MNRELWFRILQVAVVAPYAYKLSRESDNVYFAIGLKMVAGSLVLANARPILQGIAPVIKVLADATAEAQRQAARLDTADAIEGEYVERSSSK